MAEAAETTTVRISGGAGMPTGAPGNPLLAEGGPEVAIGTLVGLAEPVTMGETAKPPVEPVAPTASTLFGPRGAWLFSPDGPLWVADTGHHRLLGWLQRPTRDDAPADLFIGQKDFESEGRNGNHAPDAQSVNVPTGVTPFGAGMAVADAWNHRVLVWNRLPEASNTPADFVLGQADFSEGDPNRGAEVGPATMHWPYRAFVHDGRLYVADTGNRRVLVWRRLPTESGPPADFALGQRDLVSRDDNGGIEPGPSGLRWPHDIAVWNGNLVITDAGNNRVLIWDGIPDASGAPAKWVIGQGDFAVVDHNRGRYWPDASGVNMPYGVAAQGDLLVVADTANSRLLGFESLDSGDSPGRPAPKATRLTGQAHFSAKGDNRWGPPVRDSVCWPYALTLHGDTALLCDTGNHRIALWRLA